MAQTWPPKRNAAFDLYLTIRDADGDPVTGATALDSEISKDGAAFADCTNEATEIGTTGIYKLALTATEMDADAVVVQTKTTSAGAKTAVNVIYTTSSTWNERLDAAVSSRATQTSLDTVDDFVDTEVAAIKAKTDQLTFSNPNAVDSSIISAGNFAQAAADKTWLSSARTLTAIGTGILAAGSIGAGAIAAAELNNVADALLKRDFAAVTGEAARSLLNAARFLRNKWTITGATLTVRKEDDAATAWTAAVAQTAGNPISEIDPA
jgi:hypothetical protein